MDWILVALASGALLALFFGAVSWMERRRELDEDASREEAAFAAATVPAEPEPAPAPATGTLFDYHEEIGLKHDLDRAFATGEPSTHPRGVLYQGPWQFAADGFMEHTRRCARALSMSGVPVHLRAFQPLVATTPPGSDEEGIEKEYADLVHASISRYSVSVQQVVPAPGILDRITSPSRLGAQVYTGEEWAALLAMRVIYVVYERTPIPAADIKALSRVGQVWVACEANAEALRKGGLDPKKIHVAPVPYLPGDPLLKLRERPVRKPTKEEPPRFYHIGKWEPRKAGDRIVGAFMRAFKPGEAELYLKTSLARIVFDGYPPTPEAAILTRLVDPKVKANGWTAANAREWIHVELGRMPLEELRKVHEWGDVYVSLSRGEGFDLPSQDAKLAGNLLVYTPSGGPQDFADYWDVRVNPTGTVPCHAVYHWEPDAVYLDYAIDDAVMALRVAAEQLRVGSANERRPIEHTKLADFSAERVGARMRGYLQEVVGPEGKLVEEADHAAQA